MSLSLSPSHVNRLLKELLEQGLVTVDDRDVRPFAYRLTENGRDVWQELRHQHALSVVAEFQKLQTRITRRLRVIRSAAIQQAAFYGAGEVMEVALPLAPEAGLDVVAIVDDDPARHGQHPMGPIVVGPKDLDQITMDGLVITTFRHAPAIRRTLEAHGFQGPIWDL